jgi:hypothetical protein
MRICVVTAGHLSTCPRMVKVADALYGAGHDVHVVSTRVMAWATDADAALRRTRRWSWEAIDLRPEADAFLHRWTGARHRLARAVAGRLDAGAVPWPLATIAFGRASRELTAAIRRSGAEAVFGGTSGGLAPAHEAATAMGVRYGVDLEDLHIAEREDAGATLHHQLAQQVLARVLPAAAMATTGSAPLAHAYRALFGVEPLVVHNVWPRPLDAAPRLPAPGPLRFYWFSQHAGPHRGLEESIRAIGAADIDARLTVRADVPESYARSLYDLAGAAAPRLTLALQPPVAPDDIAASCAEHDIGLATELPVVENRDLALSNKLFMYLTSGLAVLATPVTAQQAVLAEIAGQVAWLDPAAPEAVAGVLRRWSSDRTSLAAAQERARSAALTRYHWEHPLERGRFLQAFARAFA